jgi:hypothetical protein
METAKVAMRKLHDGVIVCQASVKAMYDDDATDEELRIVATAVVASGRTTWLLVDGDKAEVKDDNDDDEAEAAAEVQCVASCMLRRYASRRRWRQSALPRPSRRSARRRSGPRTGWPKIDKALAY